MRRILKATYIAFFVLLGAGSLIQVSFVQLRKQDTVFAHPNDKWDPSLSRLNSMELLIDYIDSLSYVRHINPDSLPEYVNLIDSIIRMRFYHGLQNYRFEENWIANLLGRTVWFHFGAKVIPDHILKGQKAFCSQSSIVFQEVLRQKGFDVRSVLLPGHFCTEVLINGVWQFHDVSYKPSFLGFASLSAAELANQPKTIEQAYLYSFAVASGTDIMELFDAEKIEYGNPNSNAAPTMTLFHNITSFLSNWGWMVLIIAAIVLKKAGVRFM